MSSNPSSAPVTREALEYLRDLADDLGGVTWLAPVSAKEMNERDRWLASELVKIADELDAFATAPVASPAGDPRPPQTPDHVCGLQGYRPMVDPMCPACAHNAAIAQIPPQEPR